MKTFRHVIAGLAFSAVLALSLAANTSEAFAAHSAPNAHGATLGGANSDAPLTPYDALGITWE